MASKGTTRNRRKVSLDRVTERRLKDYSLAAAGVGALALAAPAQAGIASVSPNLNIPLNSAFTYLPVPGYPNAIGMFNSQTADARSVWISSSSTSGATARIFGKSAGGRIAPASVGQRVPANLTSFSSSVRLVRSTVDGATSDAFLGANEYLGFSVSKGGSTHYGWVKLTITNGEGGYGVTVNQIAIEQCPGQPIAIGSSGGGATCLPATPAPNSLWLMSLGVAGLAGLEALRRLRKRA
jgi:hypothetical protein